MQPRAWRLGEQDSRPFIRRAIDRWDDQTPIKETLEALHDIVEAGKARDLGASSMQNHEEEHKMLPLCRAEGIGVIPWSPLARGHLRRGPR